MRRMTISLALAVGLFGWANTSRGADSTKPAYDPRAAFAESDTNKDGQLDIEEFHVRIVDVFYSNDTNKDGFLSVEEFDRLPYHEDFKKADKNGDGRLSLPEFVRIRFIQFEAADSNQDGQLSIDEVVSAYERK